ncbi:MAG: hydroxymyristoyl-ACP dehydratase [Prevotellaceae bacterium]|jgi:3-hydroxyacyl-[acyl-carrier-protein] dehydratase|nr:hydroxymyristoyl-ACP dehydratase [Prevotellaceae bacterium]
MLLKDFYTIINIQDSPDSYAIQVELNAKHDVYKGHFPEQPVVPGVCIMQLIKECVEGIKKQTLLYSQILSCKFISVVNPTADNIIEIALTLADEKDGCIKIQADILQKGQQTAKLKATLRIA